jgi:hypothetical protein
MSFSSDWNIVGRWVVLSTVLGAGAWCDDLTGHVYDIRTTREGLGNVKVEARARAKGTFLGSALTGPDGTYAIPNLPCGVKVRLCYWRLDYQPCPKVEDWDGNGQMDVWLCPKDPTMHHGYARDIECWRPECK